jgi:hypothetical protein
MHEFCIHFISPPQVAGKLLDLLLMSPAAAVFTSKQTAAHGLPSSRLNDSEQVLGRAEAVEVKVLTDSAGKAALIDEVRRQFTGTGLTYWVAAVVEAGEL